MNLSAVFHRPLSEYAHAIDDNTYVFRLRTARDDLKSVRFFYADRADMSPELTFQSLPMPKGRSDRLYDWYEITLHTPYLRVAYYFGLDDGKQVKYYIGDCFEDSDDQERSDYFQLPFNLRADRLEIPDWVHDAVVYNIFPDSFADGKRHMSDQSRTADYLENERPDDEKIIPGHEDALFLSLQGRRMTERAIRDLVKKYTSIGLSTSRKAGYSPHKLRATAATSLIGRGNSIFDVQALLDHEQVTTTQLYANHKMNVKRDLVKDMEWELERKREIKK